MYLIQDQTFYLLYRTDISKLKINLQQTDLIMPSKSCFGASVVLAIILTAVQGFAQNRPVIISPEKPEPGDKVTITYHPHHKASAIPADNEQLWLVLDFAPFLYHLPDEIEMKREGTSWTTSFELSEEFKFASFYFKSGETTDKGPNNHQYKLLAYDDGDPVEGAYLYETYSLKNRYPDKSSEELEEMKADLYQKELKLHPDHFTAKIRFYAHKLKQDEADSAKIKKTVYSLIDEKLASSPKTYPVLSDIRTAYRAIGEKEKGEQVQEEIIEQYPESDIAMYDMYKKASDEEDPDKRAEIYLTYANADYDRSFINVYYTNRAYNKLFEYYAGKGEIDKMKKMAELQLQMDHPIKSNTYSNLAKTVAEKTDQYDLALSYAQKALDLTDEEPTSTALTTKGVVVRYVTDERRQKSLESRKGTILATLGFIHTQMGNYDQAEKYLTDARDLNSSSKTMQYLGELYEVTDRPRKAFEIYWDILLKEPTDDEMREKLRKSYIAYNGSDSGFEQKTEKLNKVWREKMINKFNEEQLDKEAPSLDHITDLEGNPIDTESLNNKVVVIDFWATWCGPCLKAFPYLQKIYEAYENHPEVAFIVLNSGWSNTVKDARKWVKENDYTFPVYFDESSKVTEAFEVRGIPTTYFLGKDGKIRFKKVGYDGPTMEPKMKLQIEMLLGEAGKTTASTGKK